MKEKTAQKVPNRKKAWHKPAVKNIGNAKKIVANVNVQGAGDSQFSVLNPS